MQSWKIILVAPALAFGAMFLAHMTTTQASPQQQPQADWPQTVTVTAGDVRTRVEASKMWTISGLEFQENVMAVQDSAYGTVLTIRNVGHLGTAHFLDVPGKPGEIEKENVTSLKFFVDDKPVTGFSPTMELTGKSFRMERKSNIRALELESTVSIRDNVLVETSRWHATEAIDLQKGHPLMYALAPSAAVYAFGDDSGIQKSGALRVDGRMETTEKNARWFAVFDPASGKGSVCYIAKQPAGGEAWFLLIDVAGVYRKISLFNFVEQIVPAGFQGTYQTAVGFFTATETDWEQQATKRARELKSFSAD